MSTTRPASGFRLVLAVVVTATMLLSACGDDTATPTDDRLDEPEGPIATDTEGSVGLDCAADDWQFIDAGAFSFRVPADLTDENVQGTDSQVGAFSGPGLRVSYDFGWFSPNFGDLAATGTSTAVTTDHLDATLVTADLSGLADYDGGFFTGLYVPDVLVEFGQGSALALWIDHDDNTTADVGRCITESVRFV